MNDATRGKVKDSPANKDMHALRFSVDTIISCPKLACFVSYDIP